MQRPAFVTIRMVVYKVANGLRAFGGQSCFNTEPEVVESLGKTAKSRPRPCILFAANAIFVNDATKLFQTFF